MGSNDYENIDGWKPILLKNPTTGVYGRDPWVSWWEHRQRGSMGGVDCAALEGTPLRLPADGYVTFTDRNAGGTGGRTANVTYNDGFKDQFMHLQAFVGSAGSRAKGSLIGYTGRSVADGVSPVDQHLHWHRIDPSGYYSDPYGRTNRRNPFAYFVGSGTSGGNWNSINEVNDMTPEQDNLLRSVHQAIFAGGGDAGDQSIITRLVELQNQSRGIYPRVVNLDQQTTGADGFKPSIAHRVVAIQTKVGAVVP